MNFAVDALTNHTTRKGFLLVSHSKDAVVLVAKCFAGSLHLTFSLQKDVVSVVSVALNDVTPAMPRTPPPPPPRHPDASQHIKLTVENVFLIAVAASVIARERKRRVGVLRKEKYITKGGDQRDGAFSNVWRESFGASGRRIYINRKSMKKN